MHLTGMRNTTGIRKKGQKRWRSYWKIVSDRIAVVKKILIVQGGGRANGNRLSWMQCLPLWETMRAERCI